MSRSSASTEAKRRSDSTTSAQPVFEHLWGGTLERICALDDQRAWTAEDGGRIRHSDDGGETWLFQSTPDEVRGTLNSVFLLPDGLHGWAVSDDGLVIATTSGGIDGWSTLTPEPILDPIDPNKPALLYDIHFLDQSRGWLVGLHLLKRTLDGGKSWFDVTLQDEHGNPLDPGILEIYAVDFLGATVPPIGLASAEPGIILRTEDPDGATWAAVMHIADPLMLQPTCNSTGALEVWDVVFVPGSTSSQTSLAFAVAGLGNACGYVFASKDSGRTWKQERYVPGGNNQHSRAFTLYGVSAFSDATGVACGYGGVTLVRNAVQGAWHDVTDTAVFTTQPLRSATCNPIPGGPKTAWIVGTFDAIRRSTNGGQTWSNQAGTTDWRLFGIEFPLGQAGGSQAQGWVCGQQYRIAHSDDGGASWTEQHAEPFANPDFGKSLKSIAFADTLNGVSVGLVSAGSGKAEVLFTTDGGTKWSTAALAANIPSERLLSVAFSGANASGGHDFWAAGEGGLLVHSTDGGASWARVLIVIGGQTVRSDMNGVAFINANTGLVVGARAAGGGRALRIESAQSAARTWTDVSPVGASELLAVAADRASGSAYAVGFDGGVYVLNRHDAVFKPVPEAMALVENGDNLYAVSVVISGTTHQVFVGGQRGLVLWFDGTTWSKPKSQTSLTITDLSFLGLDWGYAVGGLQEGSSVIVAYRP